MDPSTLTGLPTDSLYKFLSLSGVAIIAVSLIGPLGMTGALEKDATDNAVAVASVEVRSDELMRQTQERGDRVNKLEARAEDLASRVKDAQVLMPMVPDEERFILQSRNEYVQRDLAALSDSLEEGRKERIELDTSLATLRVQTSSLDRRAKQLEAIAGLQRVGVFVGLLMTVMGFWLWYYRLQRHIDAAYAAQAAKLTPPPAPPSTPPAPTT